MPNYMRYFGSNNAEGFGESWVEAEMSWVEVDSAGWSWVEVGAQFSNTQIRTYGDKVYTNFLGLNVPENGIECRSFTDLLLEDKIFVLYI